MTNKERANRETRNFYARVASDASIVCPVGDEALIAQAMALGYAEEEIRRLPKGALVGLGCGNPLGFAELKKGETVIDLGCGGGRDALLASQRVGGKGRVIGLDMTPEMIEKAKANAREGNYRSIEFKLAEIEDLPVEDGAVDCIISNCVINHSPDPAAVFREAYRLLKPGGRMAISDLVIEGELSQEVRRSLAGSSACLAASLEKHAYLNAIERAGFQDIAVLAEHPFSWGGIDPRLVGKVTSVQVKAFRKMRS
jgi:SAM-dependent methyltransferase